MSRYSRKAISAFSTRLGAENSVSVVQALIDRSANANTSFEVQSSRLAEGCGRINAKMEMPLILH